jgi:hypothetical protein
MSAATKNMLADYAPEEVDAIVAKRCEELANVLGWPVAAPRVQRVDPIDLASAAKDDAKARSEKIRGKPREQGFWSSLASGVLELFGPSMLGYFAAGSDTLFLNSELVPAQGGYVLLHELTHAAQWQSFPELFHVIDRARVAAEDAQDRHGDGAVESVAARVRYESLVTFIEGHATMIGRRACEERLTRDAPPSTPPEEVKALVAQLVGLDLDDETTQRIYVRGEKVVGGLEPAQLKALFSDPEAIVKLFTTVAS